MAKRTIENCAIMKRNIKARNEEMINDSVDGKCGGIKHHEDYDDVIYPCNQCKIYYGNAGH